MNEPAVHEAFQRALKTAENNGLNFAEVPLFTRAWFLAQNTFDALPVASHPPEGESWTDYLGRLLAGRPEIRSSSPFIMSDSEVISAGRRRYSWPAQFVERVRHRITAPRLRSQCAEALRAGLPEDLVPAFVGAWIRKAEDDTDAKGIEPSPPKKKSWEELLAPLNNFSNQSEYTEEVDMKLNDDGSIPFEAPAKAAADAPEGDPDVSAKEGDACRKAVRALAEKLGYRLTETGGAVVCSASGKTIAECKYRRGSKNGAWKAVHEQLSALM